MKINSKTNDQLWNKIVEINFEPIIVKLMYADNSSAHSMSESMALKAVSEYQKFLYLNAKFPGSTIVPTKMIDKVWHEHILDTRKYYSDCFNALGFFLHHFPYFGIRSEVDSENLDEAFEQTLRLWSEEFHTVPTNHNSAAICEGGGNYIGLREGAETANTMSRPTREICYLRH